MNASIIIQKGVVSFIFYLKTAEVKYRTLYHAASWAALMTNHNHTNDEYGTGGETQGGCNRRGGQSGQVGRGVQGRRNRWSRMTFHNCCKLGHIKQYCWAADGGSYGENVNEDNTADFPGVDNQALCRPPWSNDPRERILPDGTAVKWCSLCGSWGDHFRAQHPANAVTNVEVIVNPNGEGIMYCGDTLFVDYAASKIKL